MHGGGGTDNEWVDYGVLDAADRLMSTRTIAPFLIVLPQGNQEYWVDHVTNQVDNGERWGTDMA